MSETNEPQNENQEPTESHETNNKESNEDDNSDAESWIEEERRSNSDVELLDPIEMEFMNQPWKWPVKNVNDQKDDEEEEEEEDEDEEANDEVSGQLRLTLNLLFVCIDRFIFVLFVLSGRLRVNLNNVRHYISLTSVSSLTREGYCIIQILSLYSFLPFS